MSETTTGSRVRMFETPDGPRWVAADLCRALELKGGTTYWTAFLGDSETAIATVDTRGQRRRLRLVTEGGMHRLLHQSNTPAAREWQEWFVEMLVTLKRHGCYPAPLPMTCAGPGRSMLKPDTTGPDLLRAIGIPMPERAAVTAG